MNRLSRQYPIKSPLGAAGGSSAKALYPCLETGEVGEGPARPAKEHLGHKVEEVVEKVVESPIKAVSDKVIEKVDEIVEEVEEPVVESPVEAVPEEDEETPPGAAEMVECSR